MSFFSTRLILGGFFFFLLLFMMFLFSFDIHYLLLIYPTKFFTFFYQSSIILQSFLFKNNDLLERRGSHKTQKWNNIPTWCVCVCGMFPFCIILLMSFSWAGIKNWNDRKHERQTADFFFFFFSNLFLGDFCIFFFSIYSLQQLSWVPALRMLFISILSSVFYFLYLMHTFFFVSICLFAPLPLAPPLSLSFSSMALMALLLRLGFSSYRVIRSQISSFLFFRAVGSHSFYIRVIFRMMLPFWFFFNFFCSSILCFSLNLFCSVSLPFASASHFCFFLLFYMHACLFAKIR